MHALCSVWGVAALTGITPEILAANGARSFREVWPLFAQWLSEVQADVEEASGEGEEAGGVVLVAHNANFDNRFLVQEQERGGFDRCVCGWGVLVDRPFQAEGREKKETGKRSGFLRGSMGHDKVCRCLRFLERNRK